MNLYHVQDADRPMWVAAESLADAISRWEAHGRDEYGDDDEVEPPQGVQLICKDYEFLPASPDSAEIEELQRTIDKLTRERDQLAMIQPRIDEARKHAERLSEGNNIAVPLVNGNYQMGYVAGCRDAGIGLKGLLPIGIDLSGSSPMTNCSFIYSSPDCGDSSDPKVYVPEPDTLCGPDGRKYCASNADLKATEELLAARNDKLEAVENLLGWFVGNHDDDGYSLQWWCKDRSLILTRDAEGKWTYLQAWDEGSWDGDLDGFSMLAMLLIWLHGGNALKRRKDERAYSDS